MNNQTVGQAVLLKRQRHAVMAHAMGKWAVLKAQLRRRAFSKTTRQRPLGGGGWSTIIAPAEWWLS